MAEKADAAGLVINWSALTDPIRYGPNYTEHIEFSRKRVFRITGAEVRPIKTAQIDSYLKAHFIPTPGNPRPAGMDDTVKRRIFVHQSALERIEPWQARQLCIAFGKANCRTGGVNEDAYFSVLGRFGIER